MWEEKKDGDKMKRLELNDFDIDISKPLKKLINFAKKEVESSRSWLIDVLYWDDGDYRIELTSSWGKLRDVFLFKKSIGEYKHIVRQYGDNKFRYFDVTMKILEE